MAFPRSDLQIEIYDTSAARARTLADRRGRSSRSAERLGRRTAVRAPRSPPKAILMLISWVLFPLLLALVSLGCGLLLERVAGVRLPGALVPAGRPRRGRGRGAFHDARPTPRPSSRCPLVVALAILGLALSPPWRSAGGRRLGGCDGRRRRIARLRRPGRAVGRGDVRRLHQARRHGHLARDHRPDHGARPRPRRPPAVLL